MPRCLPVRSAGPETSSTSSSSWNASPIRRPNAPSSSAGPPPSSAPSSAGGLEQPRGLEVAALAGSARATTPTFQASARCMQLALRRARTRRPRARAPRRRGRCAASSANARENSRSPVAVAMLAPGGGDDRRPAAAQRGGVEHVVVDERGRVDELDRDRGAQHAVAVASPGPRPGTPAAAAAACRRRRSSRPRARPAPRRARRASSASRASSRSISSGTCAPPASMTAATASARRHQATVPECSAMIPPAVRIQRTSRSPARPSTPPERLRAREALDRVRQVGVGLVVASARAAARCDRTKSRRTSTSGGFGRRGDLEHDHAAARAHHARHLAQARARGRRSCARRSRPSRRRSCRRDRAASSALPHSQRTLAAPCGARARACPRRSPSRPPRRRARRAAPARSPGRRCRSRRRAPGRPGRRRARSAARSRQRWCSPAVMTEFMRS